MTLPERSSIWSGREVRAAGTCRLASCLGLGRIPQLLRSGRRAGLRRGAPPSVHIEADGVPQARCAALRAGPARIFTASRVVERRQCEVAPDTIREGSGFGAGGRIISVAAGRTTGAPLSWPQRCQLARHGCSGHIQGSAWGIQGAAAIDLRLDPTRCVLLRRCGSISSPQLAFVRTRTAGPLSWPQRCQLARHGGSGYIQGSA